MTPESSASPATAPIAPVPERTAAAILGSMIFLILLLTAILVRSTWADPAAATDVAPVTPAGLAGR